MIPLYDRNRRRHMPFVTIALIAVNALVFLLELRVAATDGEDALEELIDRYGVNSGRLVAYISGKDRVEEPIIKVDEYGRMWKVGTTSVPLSAQLALLPLLTSLFLHAGWAHILGNMWFLWVFGDNVEDALGHLRFLIFYLATGLIATIVHVGVTIAFSGATFIPTIGASGAVSGVLGAYFVAFPHARIVTLFPIFLFFYLIEIPAFLFLLFWFVFQQVIPGLGTLSAIGAGGVAFWAHIGGFGAGAAYLWFRLREESGEGRRYVPFRHIR